MPLSSGLKNVELLSDLEPKDLEALEALATKRSYRKNTVIVTQGDETESLYVLVKGLVRIYVSDSNGRELILNTLHPGDSFGELALLSDRDRSASALTLEDSRFLVISKSDFMDCMAEHPGISKKIIKLLIERVFDLTDEASSLALLDVYGRVRRVLLEDTFIGEDGKTYKRRVTHMEIAKRIGSSREMVSKIINDLTMGNYITIEKQTICVEKDLPVSW